MSQFPLLLYLCAALNGSSRTRCTQLREDESLAVIGDEIEAMTTCAYTTVSLKGYGCVLYGLAYSGVGGLRLFGSIRTRDSRRLGWQAL